MPRREDQDVMLSVQSTTASTTASSGTVCFVQDAHINEELSRTMEALRTVPDFARYISIPQLWSRYIGDVVRQAHDTRRDDQPTDLQIVRFAEQLERVRNVMDRADIPREGRTIHVTPEMAYQLRGSSFDIIHVDEEVPVQISPEVVMEANRARMRAHADARWLDHAIEARPDPRVPARRSGATMEFAPLVGDPEPPR